MTDVDLRTLERFICPASDGHPAGHVNRPHRWQPSANGEPTCSFCGSQHPDDFLAHLKRVVADPSIVVRVDLATQRHKAYLLRPDVAHAGDGPIKFYFWHLLLVDDEVEMRIEHAWKHACDVSATKFSAHLAQQFPRAVP